MTSEQPASAPTSHSGAPAATERRPSISARARCGSRRRSGRHASASRARAIADAERRKPGAPAGFGGAAPPDERRDVREDLAPRARAVVGDDERPARRPARERRDRRLGHVGDVDERHVVAAVAGEAQLAGAGPREPVVVEPGARAVEEPAAQDQPVETRRADRLLHGERGGDREPGDVVAGPRSTVSSSAQASPGAPCTMAMLCCTMRGHAGVTAGRAPRWACPRGGRDR